MFYICKIYERIHNFLFCFFLKIKFGKRIQIGRKVLFRKKVLIRIEKNGKLIIGNNCFFNNNCSINCMNYIKIGDNNLFGENVKIYDHDHVICQVNRAHLFNYGKIIIGNDNWFGSSSIILRKTSIGNNNVFSCNLTINQKYDNNNLVKKIDTYQITKIKM